MNELDILEKEMIYQAASLSREIDDLIPLLEEAKKRNDCAGFSCSYCMDITCLHDCHSRNRFYKKLHDKFPRIFKKRIWHEFEDRNIKL